MQLKSAQAETTLQSMLPLQVSRKRGGRERFREQQPLGSDFPCFTTTKTIFQKAHLKEFFPSSPQRGESLEELPSVTASNRLGSACQQHLSTAKAALLAQVLSQHSSKERQRFPIHKAIPLPHSQEMPGLGSSCSETSSDFHTTSTWFDSEPICQRPQYYAIKFCLSHF